MKRYLTILLAALLFLSSCERVGGDEYTQYTEYSFDWFDTVTTVSGYAKSKDEFDGVYKEIAAIFEEYHKLYNIYYRYEGMNNLNTVNSSEGKVEVDVKIIDLLEFGKDMYTLTNGKTNIAMGSVLSLWHDRRDEGKNHPDRAKLPDMEELTEASGHVDISDIVTDRENGTVELADSELTVDVGAIAKGYAVEMAARHLEENGISGYLINSGGNVRAVGKKPNGDKWACGVEKPDSDGEAREYIEYLALENEAVVISGIWQRYYIVDGKSYHHIIDSETLMPSERFSLVCVVCDNSAVGDALSTGLFCMSYEEGRELVEGIEATEALWVTDDGEIFTSSGFDLYRDKEF